MIGEDYTMEEPDQTPGSINQNPQTINTLYNQTGALDEREIATLEEQENIQLVETLEEQENIRMANTVHGLEQGNAQQQSKLDYEKFDKDALNAIKRMLGEKENRER